MPTPELNPFLADFLGVTVVDEWLYDVLGNMRPPLWLALSGAAHMRASLGESAGFAEYRAAASNKEAWEHGMGRDPGAWEAAAGGAFEEIECDLGRTAIGSAAANGGAADLPRCTGSERDSDGEGHGGGDPGGVGPGGDAEGASLVGMGWEGTPHALTPRERLSLRTVLRCTALAAPDIGYCQVSPAGSASIHRRGVT